MKQQIIPFGLMLLALILVVVFISAANRREKEVNQAHQNFLDLSNPRLNLSEDDIIETIQADSAESIKTAEWLDKELDKKESLADMMDRDIKALQFRTAQGITNWNNGQDFGAIRTRQGIEKINFWEKQMEQTLKQTALETKKNGGSDQDAESAIFLAIQIKQPQKN